MISITIWDDQSDRSALCFIPGQFGPALRSAIEDISNEIGGRLEGIHQYNKEDALTEAATALGPLRAAVNAVIPEGHEDHETPTSRFYLQDAREALRPVGAAINEVIEEGHPDYE